MHDPGPLLDDLTDTEAQILAVLADPANQDVTVEEKASRAGVSRRTWFRTLAKPEFQERAHEIMRAGLRSFLMPVMSTLARSALFLGKDGVGDRKLFFALVGELDANGQKNAAQGGGAGPKGNAENLDDVGLLALYTERGLPIPAVLRARLEAAGRLPRDGGAS